MTFAIVGAGVMGTNHARVARSLPGVRIAYVVDPDRECAERVAASCGAVSVSTTSSSSPMRTLVMR